jgi:FixJ family two-component response regulator
MTANAPGYVLIVDDDARHAAALGRELGSVAEPRLAHCIADARAHLGADGRLAGAVVDVRLPDGSGLVLVSEIRQRHPVVPVLVLTGLLDRRIANRVQLLGAEYVVKPPPRQNVRAFRSRIVAVRELGGAPRAAVIERLVRQHALTSREADVVRAALRGVARDALAPVLGIEESTAKTLIRRLLAKTGDESLLTLCARLLRDAAEEG